ncbi:MAG TPA: prolyl oligopeptidase family serine peptidase [Planctomycetota bacterium]
MSEANPGFSPPATALALLVAACATLPASGLRYPATARGDTVDDYFGTRVADPYRWLEDLGSAETRAWVEAQNALSRPLLAALPARGSIRQRLGELWSYERYSPPRVAPSGARVYTRHDGLQNQPVLYVQDAPDRAPRVLLDPNAWSGDGTEAMVDWKLSPDGRHLAYAVQSGGTDWVEYRVLQVATGRQLPDRVAGVNFNFDFSRIFWRGGNSGFFYSRFPDPPGNEPGAPREITHQKVYFHRLGSAQKDDVLVYERSGEPKWFVWGEPSDDGRYLLIYVEQTEDGEKQVLVKDLRDPGRPQLDAPSRQLVGDWNGKYYFAGNAGPVLYFRTSAGAPRYRIVSFDLRRRGAAVLREVVPESADVMLDAKLLGGHMVVSYLHDAASRLARFTAKGAPLGEIALPGPGTVSDLRGSVANPSLYFSFQSFNRPGTVYRHDVVRGATEPFNPPQVAFTAEGFTTEQVFFQSKDGTRVPMFISRHKKTPAGPAPTLLYGYGGFANPLTPTFSVPNLVWMERGGVYAQVSLRGGTEYGEAWHEAGMLANKQNVFDDFIAAAEFLIREGVTTPAQLAAKGRSNGGLLVGAVVNQRPDLFGAATPAVGVLDMLRYHKFGIAYAWAGDYGMSDNEQGFRTLHAYSPVHNVRPGLRYPAVLVTTADHDDRVHPLHSFKYTAALQAAQTGDRPILIRVDTRSGHGAGGVGTPMSKQIEENADVLAFLERYTSRR